MNEINQIAEEIKMKVMDQNFINKYGTSVSDTMANEYKDYIEKRYTTLHQEFMKIDKNGDDYITIDELTQFLNTYTLEVNYLII